MALKARSGSNDAVHGGEACQLTPPRDETVRQAQLSVDNAKAKLQALQNGAKPATVAAAQASADSAKAKLVALQVRKSECCPLAAQAI